MSKLVRFSWVPLVIALAGCASNGDERPDYAQERLPAAELYEQAQRAASRGEYTTALERLETLQSQYPFEDYAIQAQLDTIYVNFRAEEPDAVIASADRFIRLNPTHPRVDYAYYMRAWANVLRGADLLSRVFPTDRSLRDPEPLRQAYADFRRVVTEHPDSEYAEDAKLRMKRLREQLGQHELAVARYYLDRGAYVAAANRAKTLMLDYQDTALEDEAMEILAEAYDRLELGDLRDEVREVLQRGEASR